MAAIGRQIAFETAVIWGEAKGSASDLQLQNELDDNAEESPKEPLKLHFALSRNSKHSPPVNPASGSRKPVDRIWTVKSNVDPSFQAYEFKENMGGIHSTYCEFPDVAAQTQEEQVQVDMFASSPEPVRLVMQERNRCILFAMSFGHRMKPPLEGARYQRVMCGYCGGRGGRNEENVGIEGDRRFLVSRPSPPPRTKSQSLFGRLCEVFSTNLHNEFTEEANRLNLESSVDTNAMFKGVQAHSNFDNTAEGAGCDDDEEKKRVQPCAGGLTILEKTLQKKRKSELDVASTSSFLAALTRGGPPGVSRHIDLHPHDALRYMGDMLAWVQAIAPEREVLLLAVWLISVQQTARSKECVIISFKIANSLRSYKSTMTYYDQNDWRGAASITLKESFDAPVFEGNEDEKIPAGTSVIEDSSKSVISWFSQLWIFVQTRRSHCEEEVETGMKMWFGVVRTTFWYYHAIMVDAGQNEMVSFCENHDGLEPHSYIPGMQPPINPSRLLPMALHLNRSRLLIFTSSLLAHAPTTAYPDSSHRDRSSGQDVWDDLREKD
ncbi:hypothetical protein EV360DRAFT_72761 [Lentinula raphanica]|nr:hypothetical protein EV360DRAFT_72761 [Lentinula raphanica]